MSAFSTTRIGMATARVVGWPLDRVLLRVTCGRIGWTLTIPSGLLETTGARTGARRRNAVIYVRDGDGVVVAASRFGAPRHPAWFHNLVAHPDVRFNGIPMHATVLGDAEEVARWWARLDNVLPAFATYRDWAAGSGRTIPLVRLSPH
jgi:deazaflavin-dependent oxidoreductase (nitroreductase family)